MKNLRFWLIGLILGLLILACAEPLPSDDGSDYVEPGDAATPGTQIDAKEAIQIFAWDVLGLDLPELAAGGTSGQIDLPIRTQEGVDVAIDLAGSTYFGLWRGGAASLSFGDGQVSGDWIADVQDGTLGVFVVRSDLPLPADADAALQLALETYPNLQAYSFYENPSEIGYSFTAADAEDVGVMGWSVTLRGSTIKVGVAPQVTSERSIVWAVVASGVLAAPIAE